MTGFKVPLRRLMLGTVRKDGRDYACTRDLDTGEIVVCDKWPVNLQPATRPEDMPKFEPLANLKSK